MRDSGWLDPAGWDEADHAYMQAELRAVTLAWLAGLACPVINRPDAALWYRAGAPLFTWRPLLRRSGLPLPEIVVTSDPTEARAFRFRLAGDGVSGAVYAPLTQPRASSSRTMKPGTGSPLWKSGRRSACPSRTARHARLHRRQRVIWDRAPPPEAVALEPALLRFAEAAHLAFVEIAVAPVRRGLAVVMVDPLPRLEHFAPANRARILDALVALLDAGTGSHPRCAGVLS